LSLARRVLNRIIRPFGMRTFTKDELTKDFEQALRRVGRRSPAFAGWTVDPTRIAEPEYSYVVMFREFMHHPVLRQICEGIIRECVRNWGQPQPLFKLKCETCGHEHQEEVDACEECEGSSLREPDSEQMRRLKSKRTRL
jgi:hypothetical protein